MDFARCRTNAHRLIPVAGFGRPVPIRALTRPELLTVDDSVAMSFGVHEHPARSLATQRAVAEMATGLDGVGDLTPREVAALFAAWEQVQVDHMPDAELLGALAQLQLVEGRGFLIGDANAAGHSTGPGDFFGQPVGDLTDGQLAYYLTLRDAHTRWSEKQCKTLSTLRSIIARRSATTSHPRGTRSRPSGRGRTSR